MRKPMLFAASATLLAGVAACDPKAGDDYQGEPLLTLQGSVVIENPEAPAELVPALAFMDNKAVFHLLDVDYEGEFPAKFRLDVLVPPPPVLIEEARERARQDGADSAVLLGWITAVTPSHPPTIVTSKTGQRQRWCERGTGAADHLPRTSPTAPPGTEGAVCFDDHSICTAFEDCYRRVQRCGPNWTDCKQIIETGDPKIARDRWSHFAGRSSNYRVLYLEKPWAAKSTVSQYYAAGRALDAGYHLIKLRVRDVPELERERECNDRADRKVLDFYEKELGVELPDRTELTSVLLIHRWNATHGTDFKTYRDLVIASPKEEVQAMSSAIFRETSYRFFDEQLALECMLLAPSYEYIGDPGSRAIEVRIGPDLSASGDSLGITR